MHAALKKGPLFYKKNTPHFPHFYKKHPPFYFLPMGLIPGPVCGGAYSALPHSWLGLRGPTTKGWGDKGSVVTDDLASCGSARLNVGAQLQTFRYPTISKPLLSSNAFWAKSFSQTLPFKSVTDRQTNPKNP